MIHNIIQSNGTPMVGLTDLDIDEWVTYQKYKGEIKKLINTGVFDVKNGIVEMHINSHGNIVAINATVKLLKL